MTDIAPPPPRSVMTSKILQAEIILRPRAPVMADTIRPKDLIVCAHPWPLFVLLYLVLTCCNVSSGHFSLGYFGYKLPFGVVTAFVYEALVCAPFLSLRTCTAFCPPGNNLPSLFF